MDAETRHALKQNDLAEALTHLKDYAADPAVRRWISAILLIIVVYVAFRVWKWSARASSESAWAAFGAAMQTSTENPDAAAAALRDLIEGSSDANLRAAGHLMLADILNKEMLTEPGKVEANAEKALSGLRAITSDGAVAKQYKAPAHYQAAGMYETLGKIDDARREYEAITTDARFAGSPFVALAEARLENLDELASLPAFEPGNAPAPTPPAGPSATFTPPMVAPEALDVPTNVGTMTEEPPADDDTPTTDETSDPEQPADEPAEDPAAEPATP